MSLELLSLSVVPRALSKVKKKFPLKTTYFCCELAHHRSQRKRLMRVTSVKLPKQKNLFLLLISFKEHGFNQS